MDAIWPRNRIWEMGLLAPELAEEERKEEGNEKTRGPNGAARLL